jgi:KNTase C-terminal domain
VLQVRLSADAGPAKSHDERIAAAHAAMAEAMAKHGSTLLGVGIYGMTALCLDGPYSDLDITFITRTDIGHESTVVARQGLLLNLDYQTWDESVAEARDPELAGAWADFLVLHDPDGLFPRLRAIADSLTEEDYARAFTTKVADDVATNLGKIRNAVVAADRAGFLWACQAYSEAVCRAICLRNRHYATGRARLREVTKQLPIVPAGFASLIDEISGAHPTTDQQAYDAAEILWMRIQSLTT